MTAPADPGAPPPRFAMLAANAWLRRAAAVLVFVAAAAIVYRAMSLPVASPVSGSQSWTINAGDQVTLLGPSPGPVLSFRGPVGKGVGLRYAQASLTSDTMDALTAFGIQPGAQPAAVQWITHDGGDSRAAVSMDLQPTGPHPALIVQLTSGDGVAEVGFRTQDARLRVSMSGPLAGPGTPDADVLVGTTPIKLQQAVFPIGVEVAPGAPFTLRFAQSAAGQAHFDWGQLVNPLTRITVLNLAGVRVQRPGETDPIYACGSSPKAVAWRSTDVTRLGCQRNLRLQGLDLAPEGGSFKIVGSAFLVQNGEPVTLSWKKALANPLVSGLTGAIYAGLVGWTIKMLLGAPAGRAAKPAG